MQNVHTHLNGECYTCLSIISQAMWACQTWLAAHVTAPADPSDSYVILHLTYRKAYTSPQSPAAWLGLIAMLHDALHSLAKPTLHLCPSAQTRIQCQTAAQGPDVYGLCLLAGSSTSTIPALSGWDQNCSPLSRRERTTAGRMRGCPPALCLPTPVTTCSVQ